MPVAQEDLWRPQRTRWGWSWTQGHICSAEGSSKMMGVNTNTKHPLKKKQICIIIHHLSSERKRFGLVLRALLLTLRMPDHLHRGGRCVDRVANRYESELLFPVRINKIILDSVSKTNTVSRKRCLEEYYLSKWNPFIGCVVFGNQNLASTDYSQFQMETNFEPQDDLWYPSLCKKTWLQPSLS